MVQIAAFPLGRRQVGGDPPASVVGRLVRCRVGGGSFALPLERVAEVVALGSTIAPAPRGWIGTLVRDERPAPIGDLTFLLDLAPTTVNRREARAVILRGGADDPFLGVLVEAIPTVSEIGDTALQPLPPIARPTVTGLVCGTIILGDELLLVLDADALRERLAAGVTRGGDGRITELRALPRREVGNGGRIPVERPQHATKPLTGELQALVVAAMETADGGSGFAPALPMTWVQEVRAWTAPRPLPHAPASLAGLLVWRERTLPVIDLAQRLTGIPGAELNPRRRLLIVGRPGADPLGALVIPGVHGLQTLTASARDEQPPLPETLDPTLLSAWTRHGDGAIAVLDPVALFA